ncbi:hypothetical protein SRHO_G00103710 [Serrasalmus rhombeus]
MGEPPSLDEVQDAIEKMRDNKAAGSDGIPIEVLKKGGPDLLEHIHALFLKIWSEEKIPAQLRDALIVPIFKKGDKADCGNYRGISLLSSTGKALARVLTNRLTPLSESILPESQSGFRPHRGTTDMIFTVRQLQEKCREQNQPLYMAFIDLTKAFDSVHREALWLVLAKIGCPEKYIRVLRLLHDNMSAMVLGDSGDESAPFRVDKGVKQGCVIAPTLFSIFVAVILYLIEAWTTYSRHLKALETYHQRCLRKTLRIRWEDRRTNTSVLEEAHISTITATIAQNQLRPTRTKKEDSHTRSRVTADDDDGPPLIRQVLVELWTRPLLDLSEERSCLKALMSSGSPSQSASSHKCCSGLKLCQLTRFHSGHIRPHPRAINEMGDLGLVIN